MVWAEVYPHRFTHVTSMSGCRSRYRRGLAKGATDDVLENAGLYQLGRAGIVTNAAWRDHRCGIKMWVWLA